MDPIALGDRVKDRITGLGGIVTGMARFLAGCERAAVQPETSKDGKAPEPFWVDVPLLKVVQKGVIVPPIVPARPLAAPAETEAPRRRTGGPRPDPAPRSDPRR